MAQSDFGTIDPTTKTGTALASDLNGFRDALHSSHSGATAPSYLVPGMFWIDNSAGTILKYKYYDGTDWITLLEIDSTANTHQLTSIKNGVARNHGPNIGQIQDNTFNYLGVSTGTNTIAVSATPTMTAYKTGSVFVFKAGAANTGAATLNIDGIGAVSIKNQGSDLVAGDIALDEFIFVYYNGSFFEIFGKSVLQAIASQAEAEASTSTSVNNKAMTPLRTNQAITARMGRVSYLIDGEVATGTNKMPLDDSIPQITEGDLYMTLSHTPESATNLIKVDVTFYFAQTGTGTETVAALFLDSNTDAVAAGASTHPDPNAPYCITFTHIQVAGTTSAMSFTVRAGHTAVSETLTFNGFSSARKLGGAMASSIIITEIPQ